MVRLLRDLDYGRATKSDTMLAQVIEENWQVTYAMEQVAQSEMISYLVQRYITNQIFTNTQSFDITDTYKGKNLVEYTETDYAALTVYNPGDRMVFTDDYIYQCVTLTTAGQNPTTHPAKWAQLCKTELLFYVTLPKSEYLSTTTYAIGDIVWYLDVLYTCSQACTGILPTNTGFWTAGATYTVTGKIPHDVYNAKITYQVGDRVSYLGIVYNCILISTNNLPTNATYFTVSTAPSYFTQGDNRNQQIVQYLIDITMYHLMSSVAPRNIPDLRKERYDGNSPNQTGGAIAWLKRVASGDITADLPNIDPQQGMSIRYGSAGTNDEPSKNQLW